MARADYQVAVVADGSGEPIDGEPLQGIVIGGPFHTEEKATTDAKDVAKAMSVRTYVIDKERKVAAGPFG